MNCDFEQIEGTSDYGCKREGCGRVVKNVSQLPIWAPCRAPEFEGEPDPSPPKPATCIYQGEFIRAVACKTCGGLVELDVFSCAKYGEATVERRGPDVPGCCRGCAMFEQ